MVDLGYEIVKQQCKIHAKIFSPLHTIESERSLKTLQLRVKGDVMNDLKVANKLIEERIDAKQMRKQAE